MPAWKIPQSFPVLALPIAGLGLVLAWSLAGCDGCRRPADETGPGSPPETDCDSGVCPETGDSVPPVPYTLLAEDPIVVFWLWDTLGDLAAEQLETCAELGTIAGAYGLDVDCRAGGVAPASWTVESTARMLWPTHNIGAKRAAIIPDCDDLSFPARAAQAYEAPFIVGIDNAMIDFAVDADDCDGLGPAWMTGATSWHVADRLSSLQEQVETPEEERPMGLGLAELLEQAEAGGPVFALFNSFEGGGHTPRCYPDPGSVSCKLIWSLARGADLIEDGADPYTTWLDSELWHEIMSVARETTDLDEQTLRDTFWNSMIEMAEYGQDEIQLGRVERLLAGLQAAGRLDDLILVIGADHGESPCADVLLHDGRDCSHGNFPNDFTARVPTYIMPAEVGARWEEAGYVGAPGQAWSMANLAYAFWSEVASPLPADWPQQEPVGTATNLTCYLRMDLAHNWGLRVKGESSVRCAAGICGGYEWRRMVDQHDAPAALDEIPTELQGLDQPMEGYGSWFAAACNGVVED